MSAARPDAAGSDEPAYAYGASRPASTGSLPAYDQQLAGFHLAFERELQAILDELPLRAGDRVLDLACGDGFYTRRIAERLGPSGAVTGVDINQAYLAEARSEASRHRVEASIDFVAASFDKLPFPDGTFDVVWCAQSLYSLPEPVVAIRHMARAVRPGGLVAVLENDTLHQVFLPWPVSLELPLRAAELQSFREGHGNSSKYYVGRRLPAVLAAAGLEPLRMTTHAFDRQAPLENAEHALLQGYLEEVEQRVAPHLEAPLLQELRQLVEPGSPTHLLRRPYLTMTWLNVLAFGRKPLGPPSARGTATVRRPEDSR
jgi:ubiquinone/menaquinone biosynthesis C-methylase UbiE